MSFFHHMPFYSEAQCLAEFIQRILN
jgi:hypothetical protein